MRIYVAIFLATLSTVFVPVPEEATLLAAGYAARLGPANIFGAAVAAWAAIVTGDAFGYVVGRVFLSRFLRTRLGRWMLPEKRRSWAEGLVASNGGRAIVMARFLVGLRGFVYFAVGASRYPFARFLAIDAAAATGSVAALVSVGFFFGALHERIGGRIELVLGAVLFVVVCGPGLVRLLRK